MSGEERRKSMSSHLVTDLCHLETGVHVLRVADRGHPAEGLHGGAPVKPARTHAHSSVEPVLVHLTEDRHKSNVQVEG